MQKSHIFAVLFEKHLQLKNRDSHEKNFSTLAAKAQKQTWIQRAHGICQWSPSFESAQKKRPQSCQCFVRKKTQTISFSIFTIFTGRNYSGLFCCPQFFSG